MAHHRDATGRTFFKAGKSAVDPGAGTELDYSKDLGIPTGRDQGNQPDRTIGPRFERRAVAASRIDQLLNANVIAKTQLAVINEKDGPVQGQLMEKARGKHAPHYKNETAAKQDTNERMPGLDVDDPDLQRMMSKLDLIDSLCGQVDRHGGNVFIDWDKKTGKATSVTGIDKDLTFGTKGFTAGKAGLHGCAEYGGLGKYIDKETGEAILRLTSQDLRLVLGDLLLPDEIEATIKRLDKLQDMLAKAKSKGLLIGPDQWGANTAHTATMKHGTRSTSGYHATLLHNQ